MRTFSTQGEIERTKPDPDRDVYLHDEKRPNLVVRISPKGARTFYFYRTDPTRKRGTAKIRIAPVGEWTLEQARAKVDLLNAATVEGGGVVPTKARPHGVTLGDACLTYMDWHVAGGGRSDKDHRSMYRLDLEQHAHVPMDSIDLPRPGAAGETDAGARGAGMADTARSLADARPDYLRRTTMHITESCSMFKRTVADHARGSVSNVIWPELSFSRTKNCCSARSSRTGFHCRTSGHVSFSAACANSIA